MRLLTFLCLAVALMDVDSQAWAQEAPALTPRPTPPAPPFVGETEDFAAWTIVRYTIPGLSSQKADAVARSIAGATKPESATSVVKTGRVRHQLKKFGTGEHEDIWFEHGNRITMESMWKIPLFQGETSASKSPIGPDFPELSWIKAENFAGTQEAQSKTYFVFENQAADGAAAPARVYGAEQRPSFSRAYIDADTRTPWLLQTGDVVQRYTFQPAPTSPLEVPAEYQTMFNDYEKGKINATKKKIAP